MNPVVKYRLFLLQNKTGNSEGLWYKNYQIKNIIYNFQRKAELVGFPSQLML